MGGARFPDHIDDLPDFLGRGRRHGDENFINRVRPQNIGKICPISQDADAVNGHPFLGGIVVDESHRKIFRTEIGDHFFGNLFSGRSGAYDQGSGFSLGDPIATQAIFPNAPLEDPEGPDQDQGKSKIHDIDGSGKRPEAEKEPAGEGPHEIHGQTHEQPA